MSKNRIIVDVSDAKVSKDRDDVLVTYSLGSCIGVCLYDPVTHVGGMLHYQLPSSADDPHRGNERPLMFADTGMKLLVEKMESLGAERKRLCVKIAGGAAMANGPNSFNIGKRNQLAIKKVLWKNRMLVDAADIGGTSPRNMYMNIEDGSVTIRCIGQEKKLAKRNNRSSFVLNR